MKNEYVSAHEVVRNTKISFHVLFHSLANARIALHKIVAQMLLVEINENITDKSPILKVDKHNNMTFTSYESLQFQINYWLNRSLYDVINQCLTVRH